MMTKKNVDPVEVNGFGRILRPLLTAVTGETLGRNTIRGDHCQQVRHKHIILRHFCSLYRESNTLISTNLTLMDQPKSFMRNEFYFPNADKDTVHSSYK